MLFVLRLSSGEAVQRRPTAARASRAGDGLRVLFEITCDDRLATGICAWSMRVDRINAKGAKSLDVKCELDCAKSRDRSGKRASGIREIDDRRISAPPGLDSAGSQSD